MQTRLVTAGLIALLVPAAAMAQKVSYDFDKTANFAAFKTYAHKDGTKVGQPLIDDRIVAAIDAQMAAKGFTKSEANPDVFVVYHVAFDKQKDISTYSSGYGGGYGPYGWGMAAAGRRHDDDAGARHPDRHARDRHGRRQEGTARVARHGRQGSQHAGQARKARQEHQRRGEEDLQELSAEAEDVAARARDAGGIP